MSAVLRAQAETLQWVPVASSNLQAVAYSGDFSRMFVRFKSGKTYAYDGVPRGVFDGLVSAPSKGQYLFYVVRGKGTDSIYPYTGPF